MGAQQGKPRRMKSERMVQSVRTRLQKLRKNRTAPLPLFTSASTVSLDKCDSLMDIYGYQLQSPSYLDIYQRGNLEVDERPEDWIRTYRDLKNKVNECDGSSNEKRAVKQELDAFVQGLNECEVLELRSILLEKANRLEALLDEKVSSDGHDACEKCKLPPKEEKIDRVDCKPEVLDDVYRIPEVYLRQVKTFDKFMEISMRLDVLRYRVIEYFGDDEQPEFHEIMNDINEALAMVQAIKDGGVVQVIATREEYEDYIIAFKQRFLKLVEINMRQAKTSILGGGMARTGRIRRSNNSVTISTADWSVYDSRCVVVFFVCLHCFCMNILVYTLFTKTWNFVDLSELWLNKAQTSC